MVESFLAGKKAWVPGIQGATGLMGRYAGSTGMSGFAGYTGGFDMAAGYTGYSGSTGVRGSTGIRGWSISRLALIDQGSSNFFNASWVSDHADSTAHIPTSFFNASWVSDPADPIAYIPTSYTVGSSSIVVDRVDVRGTGPEAFLVGAKKRVGKPFFQGLVNFLRRWNFPRAGL
jgi:hypothetical protein